MGVIRYGSHWEDPMCSATNIKTLTLDNKFLSAISLHTEISNLIKFKFKRKHDNNNPIISLCIDILNSLQIVRLANRFVYECVRRNWTGLWN